MSELTEFKGSVVDVSVPDTTAHLQRSFGVQVSGQRCYDISNNVMFPQMLSWIKIQLSLLRPHLVGYQSLQIRNAQKDLKFYRFSEQVILPSQFIPCQSLSDVLFIYQWSY